jgi:hypothetical protein
MWVGHKVNRRRGVRGNQRKLQGREQERERVVRMRSVAHLLLAVHAKEFAQEGGPLDLVADLTSAVCNNAESDDVLLLGLHSNLQARLIEDSQSFENSPSQGKSVWTAQTPPLHAIKPPPPLFGNGKN